jgi:hypothetical protein
LLVISNIYYSIKSKLKRKPQLFVYSKFFFIFDQQESLPKKLMNWARRTNFIFVSILLQFLHFCWSDVYFLFSWIVFSLDNFVVNFISFHFSWSVAELHSCAKMGFKKNQKRQLQPSGLRGCSGGQNVQCWFFLYTWLVGCCC